MRRPEWFLALVAAGLSSVAVLVVWAVLVAPVAQPEAGGIAQKIFYFHVPSAYALYLAGLACFFGSAAHLLRESDDRNALARAGAEVAVVFGAVVLTTGPLWARKAWGVYWVWEPRLTSALFTVLLYSAVALLHALGGRGAAERRFAAALGVLGTFNLPLVHWAVRLWGGNHPTVIGSGGRGVGDPNMRIALGLGFLALTLLAATLIALRWRVLSLAARVDALEEHVAAEEPV